MSLQDKIARVKNYFHKTHLPSEMHSMFVLAVECIMEMQQCARWHRFPKEIPPQFSDYIRVSPPLVFITDGCSEESPACMRLGHYDHYHECFFESGDPKQTRWEHIVTKWCLIAPDDTKNV